MRRLRRQIIGPLGAKDKFGLTRFRRLQRQFNFSVRLRGQFGEIPVDAVFVFFVRAKVVRLDERGSARKLRDQSNVERRSVANVLDVEGEGRRATKISFLRTGNGQFQHGRDNIDPRFRRLCFAAVCRDRENIDNFASRDAFQREREPLRFAGIERSKRVVQDVALRMMKSVRNAFF